MGQTYDAKLVLSDIDGNTKTFIGMLEEEAELPDPEPEPEFAIDFNADWTAFPANHTIMSTDEWEKIFAQGIKQGISVYCLEDNTDASRHDFKIINSDRGQVLQAFMPKGSWGMGHRSVNIRLGKVNGPVNVAFNFMVEDAGTNLFVNGAGKWGPAIQYGPIQSGTTGGIRFMPFWSGGASVLGKQDLSVQIQNQPDGGQWLQPPYYGFRPIEVGHWYDIHLRMTGGSHDEPTTVKCEYWKDADPLMSYVARTTNHNAVQGSADVMVDLTCFFGGGEANKAPADAHFRYGPKFRIWVEA